jgi:hypothetical protein
MLRGEAAIPLPWSSPLTLLGLKSTICLNQGRNANDYITGSVSFDCDGTIIDDYDGNLKKYIDNYIYNT